jgi:histidine triad (HIT) family protein
MATVFTRIIDGELPGRFVWRDEHCVAFLSINPLAPGHTLVVPRVEVDHWIDVPGALMAHLTDVSQTISRALQDAFDPVKVALLIVGEEVPHTHLHLVPFHRLSQLNFASAERDPDPAALDDAAERIRAALREAGFPHPDALTAAD